MFNLSGRPIYILVVTEPQRIQLLKGRKGRGGFQDLCERLTKPHSELVWNELWSALAAEEKDIKRMKKAALAGGGGWQLLFCKILIANGLL